LDDSAKKLLDAGHSLLNAKNFKELLSLILLVGNYMNGTGVKGGAFGFRVSSINKLVDTKSVNNTTLLHFLERTVAKHFPDMEEFLEELNKPAEAYRVNLQEVRKSLSELREGIKRIRQELTDHFSNLDPNNKYGKQMWSFLGKATAKLEDLTDDVNAAESTFTEVIGYYGEDEKNMSSSEFYGVFKTFVTSYKKCKTDNQTAAELKAMADKRRRVAEEAKASRQKALENAEAQTTEDTVLDDLLMKLRNGDSVGRRARRGRHGSTKPSEPLTVETSRSFQPDVDTLDTVGLARDMLAALKSDGFEAFAPSTPTTSSQPRRTRRRKAPGGLNQSDTPRSQSPTVEDGQSLLGSLTNDSPTLMNESVTSNLDNSIMSADDETGTLDGDETVRLSY